ncbi:hypothetical protein N431DRAFT_343036 [Stipitochalara longipes BDJ]|nr:hypothetical protein N431DRAFT_343036 [Stipitochalara longipes BDJ]
MALQPCASCNKSPPTSNTSEQKSLPVCSDCKQVHYCSQECQKEDWKYHKFVCKQYGDFMSSRPRPSARHRLALLFPVNAETPKLYWVEVTTMDVPGKELYEMPLFQQCYGPATPSGDESSIATFFVSQSLRLEFPTEQKYDIDHNLLAFTRSEWALDGSVLNKSIKKMMRGRQAIKYKGVMLVLGAEGTDPANCRVFQDFRLADLRILADFLGLFGGSSWGSEGNITSDTGDAYTQVLAHNI